MNIAELEKIISHLLELSEKKDSELGHLKDIADCLSCELNKYKPLAEELEAKLKYLEPIIKLGAVELNNADLTQLRNNEKVWRDRNVEILKKFCKRKRLDEASAISSWGSAIMQEIYNDIRKDQISICAKSKKNKNERK
jgi:hypothetical protein